MKICKKCNFSHSLFEARLEQLYFVTFSYFHFYLLKNKAPQYFQLQTTFLCVNNEVKQSSYVFCVMCARFECVGSKLFQCLFVKSNKTLTPVDRNIYFIKVPEVMP